MNYKWKNKKFIILVLVCVLTLCGGGIWCVRKAEQGRFIGTISMEDALADYDYMWAFLEENYPLFGVAERKYGVSMDALKENYRGQIEGLGGKQIDFCEYYEKMQECIGKFRQLGHLSILSPTDYLPRLEELRVHMQAEETDGQEQFRFQLFNDPITEKRYQYLAEKYDVKVEKRTGEGVQAGEDTKTEGGVQAGEDTKTEGGAQAGKDTQTGGNAKAGENMQNLEFREISVDTGYVKVRSFRSSHIEKDREKLGRWFAQNANKKYIVIDITGNGGGSSRYWVDLIAAPNIDRKLNMPIYFLTSYGEGAREQFAIDGVTAETLNPNLEDLLGLPGINREDLLKVKYYGKVSMDVEPAYDKKVFSGRFFLLVDDRVYSAADAFAMFCKETGFATVVGKNTRGDGSGTNVYELRLPESGLIMRYRAMHGLNADGSSNVEFGTTPDVVFRGLWGAKDANYLGFCLDYIESMEE